MECPVCGTEDLTPGTFCSSCGAAMQPTTAPQDPALPIAPSLGRHRLSRAARTAIMGGVAVLVIAGGALGFWLLAGPTPEEAIAAVADKVDGLETFGFTMEMRVEVQGQSLDMEFEGVAEDNSNPAAAKVAMDGSMRLLGQTIGMSEVILDGRLYLKYDPDPFGAGPQWYYMDFDLSGLQTANQGSANPAEYLDYMKAYSTVESKGREEIDGVKCEHYYLVIDGEKIADMAVENYSELMGQLPEDANDGSFDAETLREMYADADLTMDLYIGVEDGMPYRQVLEMKLGGALPIDMVLTMDLFDFNKPVDIKAPAGAIPLPAELGGTTGV